MPKHAAKTKTKPKCWWHREKWNQFVCVGWKIPCTCLQLLFLFLLFFLGYSTRERKVTVDQICATSNIVQNCLILDVGQLRGVYAAQGLIYGGRLITTNPILQQTGRKSQLKY